MANIKRVRVTWSGSAVTGPGVSTFYFTAGATGFPADLQTFFQAIKTGMTTGVTISVPNTGDTIDETTGALSGVWTDSGGGTTTGTNNLLFVAGTGIRVKWVTGGIHNGRRVVGSTFLCPLVGAAFDTDGTPTATTVSNFSTAASALVSAVTPDMVVWSRPTPAAPNSGESNAVLAAVVPDATSWLRSRRL